MLKLYDKGRYDPNSLEPGEGFVRFWDGHEEPIEHGRKIPNGFIFWTLSGKYIYDTIDRSFYRLVWRVASISYISGAQYREERINVNHEIASILYKEKEQWVK